MLKNAWYLLAAACTLFVPSYADAADVCQATALRDVRQINKSANVVRRGQIISDISYFRRSPNGRSSFCDRSERCYPLNMRIGAKEVPSLRVNENCVVDTMDITMDKDSELYSVAVINSPVRRKSIYFFQSLIKLGVDTDTATMATNANVGSLNSECARLARSILNADTNSNNFFVRLNRACRPEKRK